MTRLEDAGVPFLVGGAFALARFTGIERNTKDFDVFVKREDIDRTLEALTDDTCTTELSFPHWLGKAICGDDFVDIIFSSGNAVAHVDDEWFEHAPEEMVLGRPAKLSPPEEMIWSKAFIMERERYDGADIAHLLRHCSGLLNWDRLLRRFGHNWRVLLSHLILFGFIYPGERSLIPSAVMKDLVNRLLADLDVPTRDSKVCQGTLLSRAQYLVDIDEWGYEDARLAPRGAMTEEQIAVWTAAIDNK
jgi:hypothetical protein